jgi:hypothetical protein
VFAAGRFNRRTEGELPLLRTEDDLEAAVGARFVHPYARVTGQLIVRQTELATTGGPDQRAYGAHGELVVPVWGAPWLELGYRFGVLDPSDLFASDRITEHTAGVAAHVARFRSRFMINATHAGEQSGRVLDNDRIEALIEVSL